MSVLPIPNPFTFPILALLLIPTLGALLYISLVENYEVAVEATSKGSPRVILRKKETGDTKSESPNLPITISPNNQPEH